MKRSIFTKYITKNTETMTRTDYIGAKITLFLLIITFLMFITFCNIIKATFFPGGGFIFFDFIVSLVWIGFFSYIYIASLMIDIERFQDIGLSGYWCLLMIIPSLLIPILKSSRVNEDPIAGECIFLLSSIVIATYIFLLFKKGKSVKVSALDESYFETKI